MTCDNPRRKFVASPDVFTEAILSDSSRTAVREQMDQCLSEGGGLYADRPVQPSTLWTSVAGVVSACTRRMRDAGCYPETALASIKAAVREAAAPLVSELAAEIITRDAAQVCIAAYFNLTVSELNAAPPRPAVTSADCNDPRVPEQTFRSGRLLPGLSLLAGAQMLVP